MRTTRLCRKLPKAEKLRPVTHCLSKIRFSDFVSKRQICDRAPSCVVKALDSGQPCHDVIPVMSTRFIAAACPDRGARLAAGHAIPRCLRPDAAGQP